MYLAEVHRLFASTGSGPLSLASAWPPPNRRAPSGSGRERTPRSVGDRMTDPRPAAVRAGRRRAGVKHGAAHAAFGWSVVFTVPHIYWAAGGTAGLPEGADALVIGFEALFLLGGILFGLSAREYSRSSALSPHCSHHPDFRPARHSVARRVACSPASVS